MIARTLGLAGFVCCGLGASACSAEPPAEPEQYTAAVPQLPPEPPTLQFIVDATRADAAGRVGRPVAELKVVSAESVTWPDGSLGCPQPGMMYTQALVPGYRVRIEADGRVFDYHASRRGGFVLCPPGQSVEPVRRDDAI